MFGFLEWEMSWALPTQEIRVPNLSAMDHGYLGFKVSEDLLEYMDQFLDIRLSREWDKIRRLRLLLVKEGTCIS